MTTKLIISGRRQLSGDYRVQGNKNAALALISASLLARSRIYLHNVPKIADVENLLRLVEAVGGKVQWTGDRLDLDPRGFRGGKLPEKAVEKLRGAILLLGALAPKLDRLSSALPGGCPIGRRSFDVHWNVFRAAGFSVAETASGIELKRMQRVEMPRVYLEESSVTATENALILFAALGGGIIENPAREPHVLSLVDFLRRLGCAIDLHPLYYRITGAVGEAEEEIEFRVPADYVDAGTIAIAAAVTGGMICLQGVEPEDLFGVRNALERFGLSFTSTDQDGLKVGSGSLDNPSQITAGPWPLFPTDLVSLVIVLATQGKGLCLIHDWMYEARMFFVDKLVRMGARITMCDPHRVLVDGPTRLRGTQLESPDIRAGMALVVAGLCAEEVTTIEHAEVIMRGYEDVEERLRQIGAEISQG